jgi:tetratricopeptide (TPR) repeat protein
LRQLEIGQSLAPNDVDLMNVRAPLEMNLGRWEKAVDLERQAERLDPRSPDAKLFLGTALMALRRFGEAKAPLDQGIALAPDQLPMLFTKGNWFFFQGDLDGVRAVISSAKNVSPTELLVFTARWFGVWFLDDGPLEPCPDRGSFPEGRLRRCPKTRRRSHERG